MAGTQCDVARSFCSFLGSFGPFELEPCRVGGSTRHGGGPIRRGALFLLPFGLFCRLWAGATSCWRSNATWWGPMRRGALFWLTFRQFCRLGGGATSCWRANATWRGPIRRGGLFLLAFGSLLGCFAAFGGKPRRVGGPTRHGGGPIRRGTLFLLPFGLFWRLGGGATSRWRSNTTWRGPNATWRAHHNLAPPFSGHFNT